MASPGSALATTIEAHTGEHIASAASLYELLKRPAVDAGAIGTALAEAGATHIDDAVLTQLEIDARYEGYMARQDDEIARLKLHENMPLAQDFDYGALAGLSNELKEKLGDRRPASIAEAARLPGVTPAALSLLVVYAKRDAALRRSA